MTDHGARAHATWSASSTARNWACPGALALTADLPEGKESLAAAWGTACHQVSEKCLLQKMEAVEFIGRTEKTKDHEIEVDDELAETAQEYVNYVRSKEAVAAWTKIEQKFSLADLKPPFDAGGTADAVVYIEDLAMLEVVDLKGGRGVVVEAKGNPQLRTYALGALLANPGIDVKLVQVTIVQPRAPHKDGRIRSEVFHVTELMEWTADLLAAMQRAAEPDAPTIAGDHCKFCRAAGFCPALMQKALDVAHSHFKDETLVVTAPAPNEMEPAQLAQILDAADLIGDWLNAVRAYAYEQAESGVAIPGYQLVDKRATRKWTGDEAKTIVELQDTFFLSREQMFNAPKLRTPAQIEKLLPANQKKALEALYSAESSGRNLVATTKTTRKAAAPRVTSFFQAVEMQG